MIRLRPARSLGAALPLALLLAATTAAAQATQAKPRARDLGVPFDGTPGPLNAITDVAGVEVGHTTLISGEGPLVVGRGPVRTGVTALFPRGKGSGDPVFAAWFALNGNGEMTGTTWIREGGFLEGPVLITNTNSVGVTRDATVQWQLKNQPGFIWALPVVAETFDGILSDVNGFHVKPEHVFGALDAARGGAVAEGNVGGGTGMLCNGFKGGIGTASRRLPERFGGHTVGVLVQCNYGSQRGLRIAGVPVGAEIREPGLCAVGEAPDLPFLGPLPVCGGRVALETERPDLGSIIIVVATDAPLLPHQLDRIVKRASLGIGRLGGIASNGSGDIFVAFSTANPGAAAADSASVPLRMLPNDRIDPLFSATVQATEEAIVNAMVAAETMEGAHRLRAYGLPHDQLREILRKYNRLAPPPAAAAPSR
ncbi:MAG TPA: P1 family peptidase [Longimicrobium sp.]|nr:P1 family peptidase [Longimicrobium sp.]